MKKFFIKSFIFSITLSLCLLATYRVIKARTGPDTLEAQSWDTLTAAKWKELLWMTADARSAQSTSTTTATSTQTDIPWMSKPITLKRAAHVQISASWIAWQPASTSWQVWYYLSVDWTVYSQVSDITSNINGNPLDVWSIMYWIDLAAGSHTISIKVWWLNWTSPYVCGSSGWVHMPCNMLIQAFYN